MRQPDPYCTERPQRGARDGLTLALDITASIKRPEQTCGDCELCSLACLLSTALLAAERAEPPLSLRLQSCSRVVLLLPLALQTTLQQHQLVPLYAGRRLQSQQTCDDRPLSKPRPWITKRACLPHSVHVTMLLASCMTTIVHDSQSNIDCKSGGRHRENPAHGAAAQQGAEDHVPEAPALRGGYAGGPGLTPLQLRSDGWQSRRHAGHERLEAFCIPAVRTESLSCCHVVSVK